MSKYYNSQRAHNLFDSSSKEPFRLSRTRIELFLECPRCFYLDRRLGVDRPSSYPLSLNVAVDELLKKEFDFYREKGTPHPLMVRHGINAVPFWHEKIEEWRDSRRRGITYLHQPTNFLVTGGVDDIWVDAENKLIIVEYKATSKKEKVNIEAEWQKSYKRQIELYQWLFRKNGFDVSDIGYFVYANSSLERQSFDNRLEFDVSVIPYKGSDEWVEPVLLRARACLEGKMPRPHPKCDYCAYRESAGRYDN